MQSISTSFLFIQTYYYNARTRESAWTKPEGVKIITQSEVEQMAAQQAQQQGPPTSQAGGQQPPPQGAASQPSGTTTAAQAAVAQGRWIFTSQHQYKHLFVGKRAFCFAFVLFLAFSTAKWAARRSAAVVACRSLSAGRISTTAAAITARTPWTGTSASYGRTPDGIPTTWLPSAWPTRTMGYVNHCLQHISIVNFIAVTNDSQFSFSVMFQG